MSAEGLDGIRAERARLEAWAESFRDAHGRPPTFAAHPEADAPEGAFVCTFAPEVASHEMLGDIGCYRHSEALTRWFARLGFAWRGDGRVLTAPSPETLNALLRRWGPRHAGLRLAYLEEETPNGAIALGPWLASYLRGQIPIHVARPDYYRRARGEAPSTLWPRAVRSGLDRVEPGRLPNLRMHFASVAHDLTVHAMNYVAVPWAALDALRDAIVEALPERVRGWRRPRSRGPLTIATFFDNDLNRYCYAVWSRCVEVEDFARCFMKPENLSQLQRALEVRIEETLAGDGDVDSDDTADLRPLRSLDFFVG